MRWRPGQVSIQSALRALISRWDPFRGCHPCALPPSPSPHYRPVLRWGCFRPIFPPCKPGTDAWFAAVVQKLLLSQTRPGPCFNQAANILSSSATAAGAVAALSQVESGSLAQPRRRWSPVPSGRLNHSGRSLISLCVNYQYLTTWLTVTAKQLFLSLPAWEGGRKKKKKRKKTGKRSSKGKTQPQNPTAGVEGSRFSTVRGC